MIFVLLFSITTLAGDLSKEEIITELEKITAVANKDIRLEMYDNLAEKLGLEIADDPVIKSYSGQVGQEKITTRPFTVDTAWELQWDTKVEGFKRFRITVYDQDGSIFITFAAKQEEPGKGSCYSPKKGTFYLDITAICDWEIKIVAVE